ncbi:copper resistance protein CopC [Kineosporia rhizophila]|uniref:copper resistance CopC family protein n=1 Tax=Kineosporia rhizophila TaxID=84633 RepID=UPI001E353943|nr:copper resistance protein CopC [Kineosporia rhizophila]
MKLYRFAQPASPYVSRRAKAATVIGLIVAGLVLGAGPALAHDELEGTNPEDGATIQTLPDAVVMDFSADILELGAVVRVEGPDGVISEGKPTLKGKSVTQEVAPGSPAGDYSVKWRVSSSDGHPISGEFAFTARTGNTPEATAEPTETASQPSAMATPEAAVASETGDAVARSSGAQADAADDGTTSPVLIITLVVLALIVIAGAVYILVIAPKRPSQS